MSPKIIITAFIFFLFSNVQSTLVNAQEYPSYEPAQISYEGVVENISTKDGFRIIEVRLSNKDKNNKVVQIFQDPTETANQTVYDNGDKVLVLELTDPASQQSSYFITDYKRSNSLLWLFVVFCIVVITVSKKWGVYSIVGMAYSFFVIFKFILPQLLSGHNPLLIAIIGSLMIAPVTFYLSHGLNTKTTIALVSTIICLFLTGLLAHLFIGITKLTGFGSDEAFFLQIAKEGIVNIKGIFLAGIIIGTLGILDDVTISQSSIVYQLKNSVKGLHGWDLYKKAMAVGHDHIASTVNTLILVYTGAALPLLLLFLNSTKTFNEAINAEIIADEIVRTLVASIGLVLAVPISTLLASIFASEGQEDIMHRH